MGRSTRPMSALSSKMDESSSSYHVRLPAKGEKRLEEVEDYGGCITKAFGADADEDGAEGHTGTHAD